MSEHEILITTICNRRGISRDAIDIFLSEAQLLGYAIQKRRTLADVHLPNIPLSACGAGDIGLKHFRLGAK
jgi:hypothetical protein